METVWKLVLNGKSGLSKDSLEYIRAYFQWPKVASLTRNLEEDWTQFERIGDIAIEIRQNEKKKLLQEANRLSSEHDSD